MHPQSGAWDFDHFWGRRKQGVFFFKKSIIIFEEAQNLQLILKTKCTT
jgi:hypothetical protein